jgi:hypothetical protein
MELAQLFQDLETLVVQQEPAVAQIEQKGEEVTENVGKGNTELDGAIKKAKAARRKKWICLGIVGMFHPSGLCIIGANLDSPDHIRRHGGRPCCLGSKWYALRPPSVGSEEIWPSKATILEKSDLSFMVRASKKATQSSSLELSGPKPTSLCNWAFTLDYVTLLH